MDNSFVLSWQNLTISASETGYKFWKARRKEKILLDQVSGNAKNGSLVAIMGPSGAGKTTFLSALAGKIKTKTGEIAINGRIISNTLMRSISGYLHQHFIVVESLTVKEHLTFMKALKLNGKNQQTSGIITHLIIELSLEKCIHTPIRNLSGGEKKRLGLAVELLGDPIIIYCDEPTSGLDSFSATGVIDILHKKAHSGKVVIATIHQPSSQLYNYFDEIILLNRGSLVFQGSKEQTNAFFNRLNLVFPTTPYNPADVYIHHITKTNKSGSQLTCTIKSTDDGNPEANGYINSLSEEPYKGFHVRVRQRHLFLELYWLVWRTYIDTKRNIGYHVAHFGLLVVTAFIISTLYSDIKDDENTVQNYKGLLFFVTSELIFTHLYAVIFTFPEELSVFVREESLYSSYAYFISKLIAVVPRCAVHPFVFLLIIYSQVHFASGFLLLIKMCSILFVGCISATTFGLCISAVFQSLEFIELFIMPLDLCSMLMAGIMVKIESIPVYYQWIKYSSPFYYVYESLSILQWNNVTEIVCSNKTSLPCYRNGKEVLEELGFHTSYSYIFIDILGMCILSLVFCFIGYLGIFRKQKYSLP